MKLISGMLGKEVIFKNYYEKTVVSKRPDMSKIVLTEKQQDWNWRMKYANAYAKDIYRKGEHMKERVRLSLPPHKSLYHALVKECLDKYKTVSLDDMSADLNTILNSKK
jgi:hypothetical protein